MKTQDGLYGGRSISGMWVVGCGLWAKSTEEEGSCQWWIKVFV